MELIQFSVLDLLMAVNAFPSKRQAREEIQAGAVTINKSICHNIPNLKFNDPGAVCHPGAVCRGSCSVELSIRLTNKTKQRRTKTEE
ncbi:hypothetical protein ACVNS2_19335 [Paenibacillus caseinilyticus]|uniref:hypothetical protein n=1 Tax=Paenibacillus mucilaginosus TaxID=61624 RepID=UPI000FFF0653|nr:hypothetical protein [Paenibacillus mucilaginosus]